MNETDVSVPGTEGQPLPAEAASDNAAPQVAETAAAPGEQKQEPEKPAKTFTQEEVDALVQKRLLREERRLHRRIEAQLREQAQQVREEPKRESYADDEAYIKARLDHIAEQRAEEKLRQRRDAEAERATAEKWAEKAEAASERFPDFEEVAGNPDLPVTKAMAEWLVDDEMGADVAYHLGKNPRLAAQIAGMTPVKAARELSRIAGELRSPAKKSNPPPEPISPVGSRGRSTSSALPSDSDDIETWMRKERARLAARQ